MHIEHRFAVASPTSDRRSSTFRTQSRPRSVNKRRHGGWVLDPRLRLHAAGRIDGSSAGRPNRFGHIIRLQPAGKHQHGRFGGFAVLPWQETSRPACRCRRNRGSAVRPRGSTAAGNQVSGRFRDSRGSCSGPRPRRRERPSSPAGRRGPRATPAARRREAESDPGPRHRRFGRSRSAGALTNSPTLIISAGSAAMIAARAIEIDRPRTLRIEIQPDGIGARFGSRPGVFRPRDAADFDGEHDVSTQAYGSLGLCQAGYKPILQDRLQTCPTPTSSA